MNRTEIVNYALGVIGHPRITDIDEGSVVANKCKALLPISEAKVLRNHDWPSMKTRTSLAMVTSGDYAPYANAFQLPAHSKIIGLADGGEYETESGILYTDQTAPVLVYIKIPTEDYQDITLAECIALHLAYRLTIDIGDDGQKRTAVLQEYVAMMKEAKGIASGEGTNSDAGEAWWYP